MIMEEHRPDPGCNFEPAKDRDRCNIALQNIEAFRHEVSSITSRISLAQDGSKTRKTLILLLYRSSLSQAQIILRTVL